MIRGTSLHKQVVALLAIGIITLLPGCWPKGGKEAPITPASADMAVVDDGSPVIVSIDGKPVMTQKMFEQEFDQFVDKNNLRGLVAFMPDAKDKFLEGRTSQLVIDKYISAEGVDKTPAYQEELNQIIQSAQQLLNTKFFAEKYPVQVSEQELRAFYEENKEKLPDILIARGGVNVVGISFQNEADAQAFYNKVKANPQDFDRIVKEEELGDKVRDFKLVTQHTPGMDPIVKNKILGIDKTPQIEMIKVKDNLCWVINAKSKQETQCRPFEEVRAMVEQYVTRDKRMQVLEAEIAKLKDTYNVVINKEPIQQEQAQQMQQLQQMQMQQQMQQQQMQQKNKPTPAASQQVGPQST